MSSVRWWRTTRSQCTQKWVTQMSKPAAVRYVLCVLSLYLKVCTEGRLVLEFTFDDLMRIKTWHMAVRAHREMIPRNVVSMHTHPSQSDPGMLEQISKNITRQGITNSTLNYLRVSVWSESNLKALRWWISQRWPVKSINESMPNGP